MKESTLLIAFILVIIGTIGLLINELIFDWGRGEVISDRRNIISSKKRCG